MKRTSRRPLVTGAVDARWVWSSPARWSSGDRWRWRRECAVAIWLAWARSSRGIYTIWLKPRSGSSGDGGAAGSAAC